MYLECYACSKKGNFRENNEDNFYIDGDILDINHEDKTIHLNKKVENNIFTAGVFDGLGGEEKGEEASYRAALVLSRFDTNKDLQEYFTEANKEVCNIEKSNRSKQIGSTAAIVFFDESSFVAANIGDSRIYHIRDDNITMLSKDHTMIETMIASGVLTREVAATSPYKNCLTQCLGMSDSEFTIDPYISDRFSMESGDVFVICSDGLTGAMDSNAILEFIKEREDSDSNIAEDFVNAAYEKGTKDNTTVIVIYAKKRPPALGGIMKKFGFC